MIQCICGASSSGAGAVCPGCCPGAALEAASPVPSWKLLCSMDYTAGVVAGSPGKFSYLLMDFFLCWSWQETSEASFEITALFEKSFPLRH